MGTFLNQDCMVAMDAMDESSIDLVVTSPPYNAKKDYESNLSINSYTEFAEDWSSRIPRLLTPSGAFWLNVGYTKVSDTTTLPLCYLYYPILVKLGLHLVQEIVWHFEGGMAYKRRFSHRTERWQWWVKNPSDFVFNLDAVRDATLNRTQDKRNNPLGKNPTDYWYYDRVVGGNGASSEKTMHPCQFPVPMIERIIKASSNAGQMVLDPFGGSGSTALAAYNLDRDFISIERDTVYHDAAQQRIENSDKAKLRFMSQATFV